MGTAAIDLSSGLVPKDGTIDLSSGLVPKDDRGYFHSYIDASGGSAILHPIDAIMGIPAAVKQAGSNIADAYQAVKKERITDDSRHAIGRAVPIVGPALAAAQSQYDSGNKSGAAGTILGTIAGLGVGGKVGDLAKAASGVVADAAASTAGAMQKAGDASEAAGNRLINETVGSYKSDFKRGANPGRGYNSTGQGVSMTMRSLADKAEAAKQTVGASIQKVISASGTKDSLIPFDQVADAIGKPLKAAYEAETQPGGMSNTAPYESYAQGFKKVMSEGFKNGGFTPQEVFDLKKQVAAKAKFNNTTPEGILDVRQSQVGALGGLLKSVIPDLAPLNQAYQDLVKLSDRASWRAESGSVPLRTLISKGTQGAAAMTAGAMGGVHEGMAAMAGMSLLDSVPGRTAIATGLYRGGKVLANAGSKLDSWLKGTP